MGDKKPDDDNDQSREWVWFVGHFMVRSFPFLWYTLRIHTGTIVNTIYIYTIYNNANLAYSYRHHLIIATQNFLGQNFTLYKLTDYEEQLLDWKSFANFQNTTTLSLFLIERECSGNGKLKLLCWFVLLSLPLYFSSPYYRSSKRSCCHDLGGALGNIKGGLPGDCNYFHRKKTHDIAI